MFGRTSALRLRPAIVVISPEKLAVILVDGSKSAGWSHAITLRRDAAVFVPNLLRQSPGPGHRTAAECASDFRASLRRYLTFTNRFGTIRRPNISNQGGIRLAKSKKEAVNKSQAIRDALQAHPDQRLWHIPSSVAFYPRSGRSQSGKASPANGRGNPARYAVSACRRRRHALHGLIMTDGNCATFKKRPARVFTAASHASRAVDYLYGVQPQPAA
jgi:hypothetical protein